MSKWAEIAKAAKQKTRSVQKVQKGAESPSVDSEKDFLTLSDLSARGLVSEKRGAAAANKTPASSAARRAKSTDFASPIPSKVSGPEEWRAWFAGP